MDLMLIFLNGQTKAQSHCLRSSREVYLRVQSRLGLADLHVSRCDGEASISVEKVFVPLLLSLGRVEVSQLETTVTQHSR
jgi:hypothetical protein